MEERKSKFAWPDWAAAAGGLLLAISVFVKCYETTNQNAQINGRGRSDAIEGIIRDDGTFSIWQVHDIMRFLLLLAAIAPIVLLWIIWREHQLSWPRGELTAVIGLTAATLVFYIGIIDRPGEPSGQIELEIGWYGALLGGALMATGGALRSAESGRKKKPPGVL